MILDKLTQLSAAQAITSADAYGGSVYDCGNVTPKRRIGAGTPLSIVVAVTTAAAGDGASFTDTFDFMAVQSVNENLSSHTVMIQRRIAGASLVAGLVFELPIPADMPTARWIGVRYELGTDDTVSVSAWIVPREHVQAFMAYAKGYVE